MMQTYVLAVLILKMWRINDHGGKYCNSLDEANSARVILSLQSVLEFTVR